MVFFAVRIVLRESRPLFLPRTFVCRLVYRCPYSAIEAWKRKCHSLENIMWSNRIVRIGWADSWSCVTVEFFIHTSHGDCFISHTSYVDHTIKVKNFSSLLFMLLYNQVFKYSIIVSPIVVRVVTCSLSRCLETDLAIHTEICICFVQISINLCMVNTCYHLLRPKGSAHVLKCSRSI
jgi:hypothetical protein